jgi:hypothetical protein
MVQLPLTRVDSWLAASATRRVDGSSAFDHAEGLRTTWSMGRTASMSVHLSQAIF